MSLNGKKSSGNQTKEKKGLTKEELRLSNVVSWFLIVGGIALLVGIVFLFGRELYGSGSSDIHIDDMYYEQNLNFTIGVPHGWEIGSPEETDLAEEVLKVTNGVLFDMRYHSLTKEVVPVALIQKPDDDNTDFSKFMTLAFKGTDSDYSYLQDKVKLMDDFKTLLTSTDHTDVVVDEVVDKPSEVLAGILLTGSAMMGEQEVLYAQYFEPAGANILMVTFGYVDTKLDPAEEISDILETLVYHDGGVMFNIPASSSTDPVETPTGTIPVDSDEPYDSTGTDLTPDRPFHYHSDGSVHYDDEEESEEDAKTHIDTESYTDTDGRSYHYHEDGSIHYEDEVESTSLVDEDGRSYHYHDDGSIHYDDEVESTSLVDEDGRSYHYHDDGSIHYDDEVESEASDITVEDSAGWIKKTE